MPELCCSARDTPLLPPISPGHSFTGPLPRLAAAENSSTSEEYRNLLSRILDCFVCRLRVLKEHAPRFAE